jgi:hypothetical protein
MSRPIVKIFRWFNGVLQALEREFLTEEEAMEFCIRYCDNHEHEEAKVYDKDGQLIEHRRHHHHHHHHHDHDGPYDHDDSGKKKDD